MSKKKSQSAKSTVKTPAPPDISYRLSEPKFKQAGWTVTPDTACFRKLVTMNAKFAHEPISQWLKARDNVMMRRYHSGRLMMVCRKDGTGRIFYPNGQLAVDIVRGGKNNHKTRLLMWTRGGVDRSGVRRPHVLCGILDSLGQGVVYTWGQKKRLVYTQTEGVFYDTPHHIPVYWQWHAYNYTGSLTSINNDDGPPLLADKTKVESSSGLKSSKTPRPGKVAKSNVESITVSEETPSKVLLRERAETMNYLDTHRTFPLQVTPLKPIILQINEYLVLRLIDQSNITLCFMADRMQVRFQVGVLYNTIDKIKVETVEVGTPVEKVLCPFEVYPARSESVAKLKALLEAGKTVP